MQNTGRKTRCGFHAMERAAICVISVAIAAVILGSKPKSSKQTTKRFGAAAYSGAADAHGGRCADRLGRSQQVYRKLKPDKLVFPGGGTVAESQRGGKAAQ